MKYVRVAFMAFLFVGLTGCTVLDYLAGIERNEEGEVIEVNDNPVTQIALGTLGALGGAGAVGSGVVGYLLRMYRHNRIVASGGKDDNFDGIPDVPKTTEAPKA